ncbi:predicted protein [Sclerotinia sclerotiorum 1980 UF-70]|uniref:Uncharacterized protein n=1 Tax=Sclerotinia sclerotiorum (strain ATCC 18683 / 1980 / Ss-1) TaxID=665079 RepID=A7F0P9_SCLS1|nr:predicted protein [Sclerotinia sclerotiorum 1980 UF-70]EDN95291.1 predicted protein [Sclerotinia sclerotiorum 1980 UF-70]
MLGRLDLVYGELCHRMMLACGLNKKLTIIIVFPATSNGYDTPSRQVNNLFTI